jgi:hypothetical protein
MVVHGLAGQFAGLAGSIEECREPLPALVNQKGLDVASEPELDGLRRSRLVHMRDSGESTRWRDNPG